MERNLEEALDGIMEQPGVVGVIVADEAGLCLGAKGIPEGKESGAVVSLLDSATLLGSDDVPQGVVIEAEKSSIHVTRDNSMTMGVWTESPKPQM